MVGRTVMENGGREGKRERESEGEGGGKEREGGGLYRK